MRDRIRETLARLESGRFAPLLQFAQFGLVGVSNTLISYGIEMLCYYGLFAGATWSEAIRIAATSALAFIVSVTNSYYWNNRYVFGRGERKTAFEHLAAYGKTVVCYGVTGLALAPALKVWAGGLGVPYWAASLGTLLVTIPLNFALNKCWAFSKKR